MSVVLEIQKLALVVDDSLTQCQILAALLEEEGYRVVVACNGALGVEMYKKHFPDLVLMDINMPVMDGYEATRQIKSISNHTAPLIFITSLDSEQVYIRSIEAGGDGILVRPFSPNIFKAKIKSIQRLSDLYQQVKSLQQEQQHDAELAEKMVSQLIEQKNFATNKIGILKQAAALFSGDIQLTALSPRGDVHVLLGDFTGHGLRSSIGAIPTAETFRVMTKKGFSIFEIAVQINKQLYDFLPADLFFAAGFVSINGLEQSVSVFNAGLPDAYILNDKGVIKRTFSSSHPPLGIMPKLLSNSLLEMVSIDAQDHFVLISDGIVEARNQQGEMYGVDRFETVIKQGMLSTNVIEQVTKSLSDFCQNMPQEDDISLIDIPCYGWENEIHSNKIVTEQELLYLDTRDRSQLPAMSWNMRLSGKSLAKINPIPLMMHPMQEIESSTAHKDSLYTILTELFINSLDHGVLGLSSDLKNSAEGFALYFNERTKLLNLLDNGTICLKMTYLPREGGGKIILKITDSGEGFNILEALPNLAHNQKEQKNITLSGRGIELVTQMCDTLEYNDSGSEVKATYIWHNQ